MKSEEKIYRNRLKCLECGEILESVHVHHFVQCSCSNKTFVDGGTSYVRCGGADQSKIEPLTEYLPKDVFLWGVYDPESGFSRKRRLSELEDSHLQNIALHLRTRNLSDEDEYILEKHILPELKSRNLEEVTEEISWT